MAALKGGGGDGDKKRNGTQPYQPGNTAGGIKPPSNPPVIVHPSYGREPEPKKTQAELDKEKAQEMINTYRSWILASRLKGWNVAADMLSHFLDGSGSVQTLKPSWLREQRAVKEGESRNLQRIFTTRFEEKSGNKATFGSILAKLINSGEIEGSPLSVRDYWDYQVLEYAEKGQELTYTSGGSTLTHYVECRLVKISENRYQVEGNVIAQWFDPYDWHADLGFTINGEIPFSDTEMLFLEKNGGAKKFDMRSSWKFQFKGIFDTKHPQYGLQAINGRPIVLYNGDYQWRNLSKKDWNFR